MSERTALARRASVSTSHSNARELHDHRRHQAVLQSLLHQTVHRYIRLYESIGLLGIGVDVEHAVQSAGVDGLALRSLPCAVGGTVEDSELLTALVEATNTGGHLFHLGVVLC